ncbi:MAG: NYN domain-containing protein [Patescibacteria group bacterium]
MIPKAKVYIDGANMFYAQKKLSWFIDWKKTKEHLENYKEVVEWKYYVGVKDNDEKMQNYLRYLDAIGFYVQTKPLKKIKIEKGEDLFRICNKSHIYKANFDVEMTADILLDKAKTDEVIIFSGDSDFQYLCKKLKDIGKKVIIYSSRKTISWELKLEVSEVFYLEDIMETIKRQ